jgi:hypothetical protein
MRYCLSCRYLSADSPICTRCGRSFGGRLCDAKRRHLNPPDAQFCGQCGSTNLTDATSYVPLGCSLQALVLIVIGGLLWLGAGHFLYWGGQGFTVFTGYRSPLVWVIEKCAHVLIVLFVFYFLSAFIPGEAGRQFRGLLTKFCTEALRFTFQMIQGAFRVLGRVIAGEKRVTDARCLEQKEKQS